LREHRWCVGGGQRCIRDLVLSSSVKLNCLNRIGHASDSNWHSNQIWPTRSGQYDGVHHVPFQESEMQAAWRLGTPSTRNIYTHDVDQQNNRFHLQSTRRANCVCLEVLVLGSLGLIKSWGSRTWPIAFQVLICFYLHWHPMV
jgi:hypothetical protein